MNKQRIVTCDESRKLCQCVNNAGSNTSNWNQEPMGSCWNHVLLCRAWRIYIQVMNNWFGLLFLTILGSSKQVTDICSKIHLATLPAAKSCALQTPSLNKFTTMHTSRFAVFVCLVFFQGLLHVACGKLINCPSVNQTLKFRFFVSKNGVRSQGVHLLLLLCLNADCTDNFLFNNRVLEKLLSAN